MFLEPHELYPASAGKAPFQVLDVRAPIEVQRGALPGAVNLPILEDGERHAVGIRYKEAGQQAAIALGEHLTGPHMEDRVRAWRALCDRGPTAVLCWRGGLRSELAQRHIDRPAVPRVRGGYKAVRRYLLEQLEPALARRRLLVVGGLTGSGKTELLRELAGTPGLLALDLEAAAEHRGSTYGGDRPQPSQQLFEHRLALPLLLDRAPLLLVEDESRAVGRRQLPAELYGRMNRTGLLWLECPDGERLGRIHREYVLEPTRLREPEAVLERLVAATMRLRARLGGEATERIARAFRDAFEGDAWERPEAFGAAILPLLHDYYDPLYRSSAARWDRPVLARGDKEALTAWIRSWTRRRPSG